MNKTLIYEERAAKFERMHLFFEAVPKLMASPVYQYFKENPNGQYTLTYLIEHFGNLDINMRYTCKQMNEAGLLIRMDKGGKVAYTLNDRLFKDLKWVEDYVDPIGLATMCRAMRNPAACEIAFYNVDGVIENAFAQLTNLMPETKSRHQLAYSLIRQLISSGLYKKEEDGVIVCQHQNLDLLLGHVNTFIEQNLNLNYSGK